MLARPALPEHEARKELLVLAAKSPRRRHASTTSPTTTGRTLPTCKPLLAELVEEGRLAAGRRCEGWKQPAYMHPDGAAAAPDRGRARCSARSTRVVWHRERAERLFGFHYRIEIYTPPPKRQYGYYVLPFLLGDELVARVDLKADRQARRAARAGRVRRAGRADRRRGRARLAQELRTMAGWLGLDRVEVGDRGRPRPPRCRDAVHHYARR